METLPRQKSAMIMMHPARQSETVRQIASDFCTLGKSAKSLVAAGTRPFNKKIAAPCPFNKKNCSTERRRE
jgi:hypothetical protein